MTEHAMQVETEGPEGLIFLPGFAPIGVGENPDKQLSFLDYAITTGRGEFKGLTLEEQIVCHQALREQSRHFLGSTALVSAQEL